MDGSFFYIKTMKITRYSRNREITREIDFSRELKLYDLLDPTVSIIDRGIGVPERGIGVPVVPTGSNLRDEIYFWDSNVDVKVTVGADGYILDKDNPMEYERLVNNLETLFALYKLG